jgi:Skp family chaperone for outer membrane proteins
VKLAACPVRELSVVKQRKLATAAPATSKLNSLSAPSTPDSPLSFFFSAQLAHSTREAWTVPPPARKSSHTMAAAAVDVGYLAASYSVPDTTFHSLLSEPTVELVQSLLVQIEAKARAYDDLESQKIRADVELEAAERSGEQRARALKAEADKARKEANELRQKLDREGAW